MRSYLVLDIETVPDPNLPWDTETFPPPPFHMVVALGVLWLDEALHFKKMGVFGEKKGEPITAAPEARVLDEFTRFVGDKRPHLVTYNGRTFDLPVLANRCLRHGVPFTAYYSDRDYRYRYSDLGHLDLADILTDHGAARMPKLAHVARLVGMPGKLDVDGSMVDGLYEQGRIEEIRTYCLHDVVQTAFLFLRVELLRGRLTRETYRERAVELWEALENEPRAQAVLAAADRSRALLLDDSGGSE